MRRFPFLAVLLAAFLVAAACSSGDGDESLITTAPEAPPTSELADPEPTTTVAEAEPETSTESETSLDEATPSEVPCPPPEGTAERTTQFTESPPFCIDPDGTITAVVETSRGSFTMELFPSRAPITVNSFVFLARNRFYEGVIFHRIIPGFVIQGGDAVGNPLGTGGPGYTFIDELPEAGEYQIGSVAMANAGPNTNGSQFFIVTGENGVALPPQWSIFGEITDGLDVVFDIESTGTDSGQPDEDTTMLSITITEG